MSIKLVMEKSRFADDALLKRIEAAFTKSVDAIKEKMPVSDINVIVMFSPFTIPELGITGFTPTANTILITIDSSNPNLMTDFETKFTMMLGHEMHHAMRWRGPGYGMSLKETLISEGLATRFEEELSGKAPFYAHMIDKKNLQDIFNRAKAEFSGIYNHMEWFITGSEERNLPRHAGYSLGYHLADRFVKAHRKPPSQLYNTKADEFYPASKNNHSMGPKT